MLCHALFALHGSAPKKKGKRPVCRIPTGDRWFQDFLKPMVEAAGYKVVTEGDDSKVDVTIASFEEGAAKADDGKAIRLRATKEETKATAGTVYRYDRDGLVAALNQALAGRAA